MRSARAIEVRAAALCVAAGALLSACAVGPDYKRPEIESPKDWRIDYPKAAEVANTRWWEQFDDPALNQLIEEALQGNLDIQAAAARDDRLLGALTTTPSRFFPQFGSAAGASRNLTSAHGATPRPEGDNANDGQYRANLNAAGELDLFGLVRRQSEGVQAQVYASEQGRRGVILSVVTTTATLYSGLRARDRELEIARSTAQNYAD